MSEPAYYRREGEVVTPSHAVLGGTTYAMESIKSVRMETRPPRRGWPTLLTLLGVAVALGAIALESAWSVAVVGMAVMGLGVIWFASLKTMYVVVLTGASGEIEALRSHHGDHVTAIVDAIALAIGNRA